jgi:hypothetical protein
MKDQYFGDINDYRKYSLLRHLGGFGRHKIVLAWALTDDDDRSDGGRIAYLEDPQRWRGHDPKVFDCLQQEVIEAGRRCVSSLEKSGVIPNCTYFAERLSDDPVDRGRYFERLSAVAKGADLVFLDPDNGIEVKSVPRGRRNSSKYVYWDEVALLLNSNASLLVYQHFPRVNRKRYIRNLLSHGGATVGVTRATAFRTSHAVFLLFPQARHEAALASNTCQVLENWKGQFEVGFYTATPGSSGWQVIAAESRALWNFPAIHSAAG